MTLTIGRRTEFTATLVTTTGLHIGGGGQGLSTVDDAVLRGADGRPFIPGSSFKGALRATAEKLAASVGMWSCALVPTPEDARPRAGEYCVGPQGGAQRAFQEQAKQAKWLDDGREPELIEHLKPVLCATCQLFGSPWASSKVFVDDLAPLSSDLLDRVEIRDGVGIDRDAERAAPTIKYDFEVVPAGTRFKLRVVVERADLPALVLLGAALLEFHWGFAGLGGKRSRGLGRCELADARVLDAELEDVTAVTTWLRSRLRQSAASGEPEVGQPLEEWMTANLDQLAGQGG